LEVRSDRSDGFRAIGAIVACFYKIKCSAITLIGWVDNGSPTHTCIPPDFSLMVRVKSRSDIESKVNSMADRQRRYPKEEELADRGQERDTANLH